MSKLTLLLTTVLAAIVFMSSSVQAESIENRGSFGLVVNGQFLKINYILTYLGQDYKEGFLAFRMDLDDTKGLYLSEEVVEEDLKLKNHKNKELQGKIEESSENQVLIVFPNEDDFADTKMLKLYMTIRDYKLKKNIRL